MVVLEALKARMNKGLEPNLYFYRDANQKEVGLLYKNRNELIPVEIKAAMTYNKYLYKSINYFNIITGGEKGYLVYAGKLKFEKSSLSVLNFANTYSIFE